jgi:hypothetical protein
LEHSHRQPQCEQQSPATALSNAMAASAAITMPKSFVRILAPPAEVRGAAARFGAAPSVN